MIWFIVLFIIVTLSLIYREQIVYRAYTVLNKQLNDLNEYLDNYSLGKDKNYYKLIKKKAYLEKLIGYLKV